MKSVKEQRQDIAEDESDSIEIPIAELVAAIWQRRRWLAAVAGLGALATLGVAFLIPNQYTSIARIMPPDQQSVSGASMLNVLTGGAAMLSGGSLLSGRTPGQISIGILGSNTAQDDIINRFELMHAYHCKFYADARKILAAQTVMDEDKKSGIVSIAVTDADPHRARDIASAYVEELNKLLIAGNTSSAHLERIFLEERLKSLKVNLDNATSQLSQFSSRNATLNPQSQGAALIDAAAKLQGELITAQSELYGLKAQYSDDNVRVRTVQARIDELQSQLRKMGGMGENVEGADLKANQLYPSIRELPILGATYSNLYRQMMMQEGIYETLTKQYELAKVEEAKEIPTIKLLDVPEVPERKSSPHRATIVLFGALFFAFAGILWIVALGLWELASDNNSIKMLVVSIVSSIRASKLVKTG